MLPEKFSVSYFFSPTLKRDRLWKELGRMLLICQRSPWVENQIISLYFANKKMKRKMYGRIKHIAGLKGETCVQNHLMHEREYENNYYSGYNRVMGNLFFGYISIGKGKKKKNHIIILVDAEKVLN